jgi:hypothetical protein
VERLLKQQAYVVFDVNHLEFDMRAKSVAQVQSLQKKLRAMLNISNPGSYLKNSAAL